MGGAAAMDPAGIKKPSPGFLLKAQGSLTPLNNAHIEVRRDPSARALAAAVFRFPACSPRFFLRAFSPRNRRAAAVASRAARQMMFRFFLGFQRRVCFAPPLALSLSHRLRPEPLPFFSQLFWPDDGMWYKAEVVSLNLRARVGQGAVRHGRRGDARD